MKIKERVHYIDIAKGFAMILVMLGHTKKLTEPNVVWWLYTFHMPLFFILSGMLFNPNKYKSFKEMIKSKFKSLIVPYIFFCLILWFWSYIVKRPTNFMNEKTLQKLMGIFIAERGEKYYLSMWFITALFLSENFLYVFIKTIKNKKVFLPIGFITSAVLGCIIINKIEKGLYWSIDLVPTAVSFMIVGYLFRVYKEKLDFSKCKNIIIMIIMIAVNIAIGYINYKSYGKADLYELTIGNPIYFYIAALSGSISIIILCKILKKCTILEYIGRNSLIYYAFHKSLFINPLLVIVKTLSKTGGGLENKFVQLVIVTTCSCVGLAILSETITKCFPWLLGKFTIKKFTIKKEKLEVENI